MKKILLVWSLLFISVQAKQVYEIKASWIGKVGEATFSSRSSSKKYTIDGYIKATGIAKSMSGGLKEHHHSSGSVRNGQYYADIYTIDKTSKGKRYYKKYIFDYRHKKITKISKKWKGKKLLYDKKQVLNYFAHNDALTLYHNIIHFKKSNSAGSYTIRAAGAEYEGGKLTFFLPKGKQKDRTLNALELTRGDILRLYLSKGFFAGKKGSLVFGIDKDGVTQKATLNNVKLLGTLTAYKVK
jgi:hypothetical protein